MAEAQAEPNLQGGPECTAALSETCADRPACRDERLIGVANKSGTGARLDGARILSSKSPHLATRCAPGVAGSFFAAKPAAA